VEDVMMKKGESVDALFCEGNVFILGHLISKKVLEVGEFE